MPKTGKKNRALKNELPSTLQRSEAKAQDTFAKTYDSAEEEYGDGERAARTAYASLKRTHEKVGDHWEEKEQRGPSDAKAEEGRSSSKETAGGVDANASKEHLYALAARLEISGRSKMTKDELVQALRKASGKQTRKARES